MDRWHQLKVSPCVYALLIGLLNIGVRFVRAGETIPQVAPYTNPDGSDNPEGRQKNRRVEMTVKK